MTGDPGLDDFIDDGTPGHGHFPLLETSPAIDAGNNDVCLSNPVLANDQIGEPRVGVCDIGAIEFQPEAVDDDAPDTTINSGPTAASGGVTNSTSANFTFTSTDVASTFACSLNDAAFTLCASPKSYRRLRAGAHNFKVKASVSGIADPTPASFDWTVDTSAPNTAITSAPPLLTNNPVATFTFTSTEVGGGFQCSLDASPFADCTSPFVSASLLDGKHNFQVKAVDAVGNADRSAARGKAWTVDTVRPITTITAKPTNPTTRGNVWFRFTSERKSTFQCSLDGGASTLCKSGQRYNGLAPGVHNFQVQATDAAGNVELTPASYDWTQN